MPTLTETTPSDRELRAVERALNFTQGKRHRSWRDHLEWLDLSVESAMRHFVGERS